MLKSFCFALTLALATAISASAPQRARADDAGDSILIGALVGASVGLIVGIVLVLSDGDPASATAPGPAHAKGEGRDTLLSSTDAPARSRALAANALEVRF